MRSIQLNLIVITILSSGHVIAQTPQMSSTELGQYANNINHVSSINTINPKPNSYVPNFTRTTYDNNSYVTPKNQQTSEGTDSHWMSDFIRSKNPVQNQSPYAQSVRYSNPQYQEQSSNNGSKASLSCVIQAARSEKVPLYVLLGIQSKEMGQNGQVNASNDMGHFQVNMQHFRGNGMFNNVDMNQARTNGCLNAQLAAKVLRNRLATTNMSNDFWVRAAAYHSWTPKYNAIYRNGTNKTKGLIALSMQWKNWLVQNNIDPN
ncbi:transglycosylase SLT domain-containing protein [Acinetobacter sp. Marseille-Q1618]|uniref:transglycosylase SLT domain-containing protein n=1 Tax=Acinetobacter sp. Marseille-Q1618 TaxID=2697502 RepID=UPI00156F02ED|nr:transglycosylase SLT domain-containing protein [Acinetobacter sp. Marseille-Q1618]